MQTKKYYTYIQQKCGQKPKAKWNQSQKANQNQEPKAKSQVKTKPKAKSQVGMQMGDFSSKMQQIAREAAPICPRLLKKTKNKNKSQKKIPSIEKCSQKPEATSQKPKEPDAKAKSQRKSKS